MGAPATTTPATTQAPAEAPNGKKRLPPVAKVFTSKELLDAGQKDAKAKGHDYDTRKFKVSSTDGKKVAFVLGYSAKDAAGRAVAEVEGFLVVEELDPQTSTRAPFSMSPTTAISKIQGMSADDQKAVLEALQKLQKAAPAKK